MYFGGIGGDVGRCRGIHFFFHTNEKDLHHVPHIHCKHGSLEFRVNLKDLSIMDTKKFMIIVSRLWLLNV